MKIPIQEHQGKLVNSIHHELRVWAKGVFIRNIREGWHPLTGISKTPWPNRESISPYAWRCLPLKARRSLSVVLIGLSSLSQKAHTRHRLESSFAKDVLIPDSGMWTNQRAMYAYLTYSAKLCEWAIYTCSKTSWEFRTHWNEPNHENSGHVQSVATSPSGREYA